MAFFHEERLWLGDYVVMPNHVHVLAQPFPAIPLVEWLYSVKRFSAAQILKTLGSSAVTTHNGHVWQTESFDRIVRNQEELARTRAYIANNPAKLTPGTFAFKTMDWLD